MLAIIGRGWMGIDPRDLLLASNAAVGKWVEDTCVCVEEDTFSWCKRPFASLQCSRGYVLEHVLC